MTPRRLAPDVLLYPEECYIGGSVGVEFTCLFPSISSFYTSFETHYDPTTALEFMKNNNYIPYVAIVIYLTAISLGQRYMRNREPFQCKNQLAAWNLFLCLFAVMGTLRTLPHIIYNMYTMTFRDIMCVPPAETFGVGSTGLWVQMFVLSKFPEFFDTFFIVIHKKPLLFLHWYHHITVALYCWNAFVNERASGLFFIGMNYSLHALMYGYYFLSIIKMKPSWLKASFITKAQILQMFIGIFLSIVAYRFSIIDSNCYVKTELNVAAFLMYGSYFFLYCKYYFEKYRLKLKMSKIHSA